MVTPGPVSYNQDDKAVRPTRFAGVSLGYDVKSNQKQIKYTPGPADYDTIPSHSNSVIIKTHNYSLNRGGIKLPLQDYEPKESLMTKSFAPQGMNETKSAFGGSYSQKTPTVNIIRQNKLAVKQQNAHSLMVSSGIDEKIGLKEGSVSESMAHSMTNFSKNVKGEEMSTNLPPKIPAK